MFQTESVKVCSVVKLLKFITRDIIWFPLVFLETDNPETTDNHIFDTSKVLLSPAELSKGDFIRSYFMSIEGDKFTEENWLKMGEVWSGELTTLDCAFLKPAKFFEAVFGDTIRNKMVAEQSQRIFYRLSHILPPAEFRNHRFLVKSGPAGDIKKLKLVNIHGNPDFKPGTYLTPHLDMRMACFIPFESERAFVQTVNRILFGSEHPSFDERVEFILNNGNFAPWCSEAHWILHSLETFTVAGLLKRVE